MCTRRKILELRLCKTSFFFIYDYCFSAKQVRYTPQKTEWCFSWDNHNIYPHQGKFGLFLKWLSESTQHLFTGNMWNMASTQAFNQGNSILLFHVIISADIGMLADIWYLIWSQYPSDTDKIPIISRIPAENTFLKFVLHFCHILQACPPKSVRCVAYGQNTACL